ncbi:uncharacterized protein LOC106659509 [Trichogramma pretiosum]|uniref:uncharacterized protein LOC106659509 n=1 Tax=Trichogramma pretiosum TaxID=7493 RepID=UPI0006C96345|nr:uncharacterized protein LOC106659509 [Trichogramma pretiosum]
MESCGLTAKVKEEPNDMRFNENDNGETKDQTSDSKKLQYLRCQQERNIHTLNKYKGVNEFQPIQEIKIELECKDVKPSMSLLVTDKLKDETQEYSLNQKIKIEFECKDETQINSGWQLKRPNMKIYPLKNGDKQSVEHKTHLKKFSSLRNGINA